MMTQTFNFDLSYKFKFQELEDGKYGEKVKLSCVECSVDVCVNGRVCWHTF